MPSRFRRPAAAWRTSLAAGSLFAVAAIVPLGSVPAGASTTPDDVDSRPWVSGNHTIAYFDIEQAITEVVNVETGRDDDEDGDIDTIRVNVTRPDAGPDAKVPLIVHASPYFFKGGRSAWETNFFVPRGYAVATVALPGTDFSTGCADVGGDMEVLGSKAVVDWANGRAKGFHLDGTKANATKWTDGQVGMIGVSWDGTIANALASTGVEGLETIVPVAAISSWYDYTRFNAVPWIEAHVAYLADYISNYDEAFCRALTPVLQEKSDDDTMSYNKFWGERNYRPDASKVTASVFVVHGLNDENVKTRQFGEWWDELVEHDVERRLFLHQQEHVEPYFSFGSTYSTPIAQWFDYYLQDIDNGAPDEPQAIIQRENGSWSTDEVWPPAGTAKQTMKLSKPLGREVGLLSTSSADTASARTVKIVQSTAESSDSVVQNPSSPRSDRAVFLSDELRDAIRESGTATIKLRVKTNREHAAFQARVVDYTNSSAYIVSRTKADLGHYKSWSKKSKLTPGKYYTLKWEINADDMVFQEDHVLGLVITAEHYNVTKPYQPVTATIDLKKSSITMPLNDEASALASTGAPAPLLTTTLLNDRPLMTREEILREFFEGTR